MKTRAHVVISGFVQGVFFRASTRDEAMSNNVAGWVKNLPDGRVEAVFEGEREDVEKMIHFCKKGPEGAVVRNIEVNWELHQAEFSEFKILR